MTVHYFVQGTKPFTKQRNFPADLSEILRIWWSWHQCYQNSWNSDWGSSNIWRKNINMWGISAQFLFHSWNVATLRFVFRKWCTCSETTANVWNDTPIQMLSLKTLKHASLVANIGAYPAENEPRTYPEKWTIERSLPVIICWRSFFSWSQNLLSNLKV